MSCRGVHFAIDREDERLLLAAKTDERVIELIQNQIEERWDMQWLAQTDKAWDAIHRCLTDGTLRRTPATPAHKCILGGRQLYSGNDYVVSYLTAAEVREVSTVIADIDEAGMRQLYFALDEGDYEQGLSEEDFAYTWSYFDGLKGFFHTAGEAGRAVVFTVDQ